MNTITNNIKTQQEVYFIYNLFQANYFINNGVQVVGVGKGNKGDIYINFIKNEFSKKINLQWKNICQLTKNQMI